jgi:hypothetical protein
LANCVVSSDFRLQTSDRATELQSFSRNKVLVKLFASMSCHTLLYLLIIFPINSLEYQPSKSTFNTNNSHESGNGRRLQFENMFDTMVGFGGKKKNRDKEKLYRNNRQKKSLSSQLINNRLQLSAEGKYNIDS